MKGFKILREKPFKWPGGTGTSKYDIGTKSVLPFFSGLVPVPVSVVSVPLCYYHIFQLWYQYQFLVVPVPLYKNF